MKNYLAVIGIVVGVCCLSCSKKDNSSTTPTTSSNPTLTVNPGNNLEVVAGQDVTFNVSGNVGSAANSSLSKLIVETLNAGVVIYANEFPLSGANFSLNYDYLVPSSGSVGSIYSLAFTVADEAGHASSVNLTLNQVAFPAVMTVSPSSDQSASAGQSIPYNITITPHCNSTLKGYDMLKYDSIPGDPNPNFISDSSIFLYQKAEYKSAIPGTVSSIAKGHYEVIYFYCETTDLGAGNSLVRKILIK